jgi:hypothetical protein
MTATLHSIKHSLQSAFLAASLLLWLAPSLPAGDVAFNPTNAHISPLPTVGRLRIELSPQEMESLRFNSRKPVPAFLSEESGKKWPVQLHLKGSTGSFRPLDDKPSFTISFPNDNTNNFHGLNKIHLNNSVEDPSFLNETLGSELFRKAGVPAVLSSHAVVTLNGRQLGLYIVKEGFTEAFLSRFFKDTAGNLYEPIDGHDVDKPLQRQLGKGPDDQLDRQALASAILETDLDKRWSKLQEILEIDSFIKFMAMEVMIGHRDGYCMARNNFRLYYNSSTGRMYFLPHGMDQLFGNPDLTWQPQMSGLTAKAVMETLEGQRRYREYFKLLYTNVFLPETIVAHGRQIVSRLKPLVSPKEAEQLNQNAEELFQRILARHRSLAQQFATSDKEPLRFTNSVAKVETWQPMDIPDGGRLLATKAPDGRNALCIVAGPVTAASWRSKVLLEPGRYRFEGRVMLEGVKPLDFMRNKGAGLRVGGVTTPPFNLTGNLAWKMLQVTFEIQPRPQERELRCELFACKGKAWFDLESLRLVRLE